MVVGDGGLARYTSKRVLRPLRSARLNVDGFTRNVFSPFPPPFVSEQIHGISTGKDMRFRSAIRPVAARILASPTLLCEKNRRGKRDGRTFPSLFVNPRLEPVTHT